MAIAYTTAWEISLTNNQNFFYNTTARYWIDSASFDPIVPVPDGQTHVRLRFVASGTAALSINSAYIGHGYDYDSPGFPDSESYWQAKDLTPITFSGETDVVIPQGTTLLSDPIPFVYDGTSPIIISMDGPLTGPSGYKYTNFNIAGGDGWQPWEISGDGQLASTLVLEGYVAGENIGSQTSGPRGIDRFEWGVDTEALVPLKVSKLTGYAVVFELTPMEVSKLTGYAVVKEASALNVSKLTGYVVVREGGNLIYQYSYMPVVN